jgi:hypothetical protein
VTHEETHPVGSKAAAARGEPDRRTHKTHTAAVPRQQYRLGDAEIKHSGNYLGDVLDAGVAELCLNKQQFCQFQKTSALLLDTGVP